jgi:hypothetical protein
MTKDETLKQALEALEHAAYCVQKNYLPDKMGHDWDDTMAAIKEALAQPPLPEQRQPLTEETIKMLWRNSDTNIVWDHFERIAREIEAHIGAKP